MPMLALGTLHSLCELVNTVAILNINLTCECKLVSGCCLTSHDLYELLDKKKTL